MLLFEICLRLRTRSFLRMTLLQKLEPLWQQSTEQERQMQNAAFMVSCDMENMESMFLYVPPGYIPIFVEGFLV